LLYAMHHAEARTARLEARAKAIAEEEAAHAARAAKAPLSRAPVPKAERRKKEKQGLKGSIRAAKRGSCMDCGGCFHSEAMEFDHRGDAPKLFNLSQGSRRSQAAIAAEIAKCDLVCANCHRLRSARRRLGLPATLPLPDYEI
jgi:hypothetical protein